MTTTDPSSGSNAPAGTTCMTTKEARASLQPVQAKAGASFDATTDARASLQPGQAKAGASFDATTDARASLQPQAARATGHAHGSAYASAAAAIREWLEVAVQAPATHPSVSPTEAYEEFASIRRRRVSKRETAVLELEPRFQALSNAILHLIVEGVEPARPHVGNPDFSEDMLQAFARYEQEQREAKSLRESAKQDRRVSFIEKTTLLIIGGIVTLGLKALFFPSP